MFIERMKLFCVLVKWSSNLLVWLIYFFYLDEVLDLIAKRLSNDMLFCLLKWPEFYFATSIFAEDHLILGGIGRGSFRD